TLVMIHGFRELDYTAELQRALEGGIPSLERIIYIGADSPSLPNVLPYEALRERSKDVPESTLGARSAAVDPDDVINMQYTSGTRGSRKGVMLSSRNIVNNGHALGTLLGYTPLDRLCLCVPLFHCFGCVIGVLGAYACGACLCPIEAFDPRKV